MIFNSLVFLAFFFVTYAAYLLLGSRRYRMQNHLLLVASYVFYGYWDWRFLSLIAFSTVVDWAIAKAIRSHPLHARRFLLVSLVSNLGLLFTFKYFDFFQHSFAAMLASFGIEASPITLQIVLPVGISFYTFQALSYTIDVYRGDLEPCEDLFDFALFVSFFPQLVAGPIERAVHLLPQFLKPRRITREGLHDGLWLVMWGFTKKVFVADNISSIVDRVYAPGFAASGGDVLVGTWAFAVQIYCDFSGYTDIARGLSKMMGFELMLNFDLPYIAKNPSEFWRRWHISLSTWLRDYLYIPLGGNRGGTWLTYRNLMLTMLLGGLWHGAAWTFVLWGLYHGALLVGHRLWSEWRAAPARARSRLRDVLSAFVMLQFTLFGWLLFRAVDVAQVGRFIGSVATDLRFAAPTLADLATLCGFASVLVIVETLEVLRGDARLWRGVPPLAQGLAFGVLFYLVTVHGAVSDSFIYFQF